MALVIRNSDVRCGLRVTCDACTAALFLAHSGLTFLLQPSSAGLIALFFLHCIYHNFYESIFWVVEN